MESTITIAVPLGVIYGIVFLLIAALSAATVLILSLFNSHSSSKYSRFDRIRERFLRIKKNYSKNRSADNEDMMLTAKDRRTRDVEISAKKSDEEENSATTKFRKYLQIHTEQPNPDYEASKKFLLNLAAELGISAKTVYTDPSRPFVIMTIPGSQPELSSILLYSHTDVVLAVYEKCNHDPFAAEKDAKGNIHARGSQDMKCVGIQYFEAIRRHFQKGKKQFTRTVHLLWAPDEESGGPFGMMKFRNMDEFKQLNVGFVLDEGLASENDKYLVFYGERSPWHLRVTCTGNPGHGSKFIENTAAEKMQSIINSALDFRDSQEKLMKDKGLGLGEVTSLNWTIVEGPEKQQYNVVPEKLVAGFDIRIHPTADFDKMDEMIKDWCSKAGPGVTYCFDEKDSIPETSKTDSSSPFWVAFDAALKQEGCEYIKGIFPASTDSRYLRAIGYQSIGFSPIINTPPLLHDHNEFLNEKTFLRGIEIYETLIDRLASV